jgi:hypothetical protein
MVDYKILTFDSDNKDGAKQQQQKLRTPHEAPSISKREAV